MGYVRHDELNSLGEMRQVTTLFLSLVQVAFLVVIEAAKFTGGAIRQFVLDDKGCVAILVWGVPRAAFGLGYDACRAISCAFHILHGMEDLLAAEGFSKEDTAGPHIGIATGEVYVGLIGAMQRCEYAIVGPSVNLAARLMGKAKPWHVLAGEQVHDNALKADASLIFQKQDPVKAKGYDHMVEVFVPEQDSRQRITAKQNLLDELTRLWATLELRVQLVGKISSALADGKDGEAIEFPWLALVNIVGTLNIATYAETKNAVALLQQSGFFRFRRAAQASKQICSFV